MCLCRVAQGPDVLMYYSGAAAAVVDRVCFDVYDVLSFCAVDSSLVVRLTTDSRPPKCPSLPNSDMCLTTSSRLPESFPVMLNFSFSTNSRFQQACFLL